MQYNWDVDKTILWLMPSFLRKAIHWAWLKVLLSPLKNLYAQFLIYRDEQIYEAYLTGQTIQLQRLLNDLYDNELRRIIIIHSIDSDIDLYLDEENQAAQDLVLYLDSEGQTDTLSLYLDNEIGGVLPVDFRVLVPISLSGFQTLIENLIKKYALVNKTFDIVFV